jgi:hypothetical protein
LDSEFGFPIITMLEAALLGGNAAGCNEANFVLNGTASGSEG